MSKGYENSAAVMDDEDVDRSQDFSKDENEERGNWSGRLDFLLSCLGYAVGLGNVWRFPYLCYRNGGAVFFIPYVIMLVLVGMPIFFLELSLGQFTSNSALTCWEFAPIFKGIGVAMVTVSGIVAIYYNMIIGWALYYLFKSFAPVMPWKNCGDWASPYCRDNLPLYNETGCTSRGFSVFENGTCYNTTSNKLAAIYNTTAAALVNVKRVSPSEDYLNKVILKVDRTSRIMEMGDLQWELVVALAVAWVIVFLCLANGIKSSGKVVYFTAIFPYVVLIILLVRGLTLPGHMEGIRFYLLEIQWEKLKDAAVWKDAAVQIFFSLSASWGGLITLASYNRFHNDVVRDTLIVTLGNCLTSFFAGFVIFSFIGFLSQELGVAVQDVATSGSTLAFVVYPDAVTRLPLETLWSILFFVMLITLGLDSEFALVETVCSSIMDQFPKLRKVKTLVILVVSIVFFALGLTLCTNGGLYWFDLMDTYSGGWNVLVIALLECISVMFVYGVGRFREDIRVMLGNTACCCLPWSCMSIWWVMCWCFFTPLGVLFILVFSWVDYTPIKYKGEPYPLWGEALGWLMTLCVVLSIFLTAIYKFLVAEGSCMQRFRNLFNPSIKWGPALPKHRRLVNHWDIVVDPSDNMNMKGQNNAGYES